MPTPLLLTPSPWIFSPTYGPAYIRTAETLWVKYGSIQKWSSQPTMATNHHWNIIFISRDNRKIVWKKIKKNLSNCKVIKRNCWCRKSGSNFLSKKHLITVATMRFSPDPSKWPEKFQKCVTYCKAKIWFCSRNMAISKKIIIYLTEMSWF